MDDIRVGARNIVVRTASVEPEEDLARVADVVLRAQHSTCAQLSLVGGVDWGHARCDAYLEGDAMARSLPSATRARSTTRRRRGSSASPGACAGARAGDIGPIRREIIFEPVHEEPAPVEAPPAAPKPERREPVPNTG